MRWEMGRRSRTSRTGAACRRWDAACVRGGIGGLGILAIALVAMFLGVDPSIILNGLSGVGR